MSWKDRIRVLSFAAIVVFGALVAHADTTITHSPEARAAYEAAATLVERGDERLEARSFGEADTLYADALARFKALSNASPQSFLMKRGVLVALLKRRDAQLAWADSLENIDWRVDYASWQKKLNLTGEAHRNARAALVVAREMVRMAPTELSARRDLAKALVHVGNADGPIGGRPSYAEAADIFEDLRDKGLGQPEDAALIAELRQRSRF